MSGQFPAKLENSGQMFVSSGTRAAAVQNATTRPSSLMAGSELRSLDWEPSGNTLTRVVVPAARSRTNASGHVPGFSKNRGQVFVSPGTRLVAEEKNAT